VSQQIRSNCAHLGRSPSTTISDFHNLLLYHRIFYLKNLRKSEETKQPKKAENQVKNYEEKISK